MNVERMIRMILRRFLNKGISTAAKKMGGGSTERTRQLKQGLKIGRRIGRM